MLRIVGLCHTIRHVGQTVCYKYEAYVEVKNRLVPHFRTAGLCLSVRESQTYRWRSFVRRAFRNVVIVPHDLSMIRFLADLG
jgi:hypothetical protein